MHGDDFAPDDFAQAVLYRLVYGRTRERLGRYYGEQSPDEIRADPLGDIGSHDPASPPDPQEDEIIRAAVEDALAGRRPRW